MPPRSTLFAAILLLLSGLAPNAQVFKCLPVYGNWCGLGYPPAGTFSPPVDAFDTACLRHDLCIAGPQPETACHIAFVGELRGLALTHGYLPRPLQWAEYVIRVRAGGPWGGMPLPAPGDGLGALSSLIAPCW